MRASAFARETRTFSSVGSGAGALSSLLAQPGIWTISAATLTSVIVSLADRRTPVSADRILSRLHSPERSRGELAPGG